MLVKIGTVASINMTRILRVTIQPHEQTEKVEGWFKKDRVKKSLAVKVDYADHAGVETSYTLYGYENYPEAQKVYNEVLNQVKELENVGATQALEEAIING